MTEPRQSSSRAGFGRRYEETLAKLGEQRISVSAARLMEFAYASRNVKEWMDQGGFNEDALARWEQANQALAADLVFEGE